jgi:hypothetical protein
MLVISIYPSKNAPNLAFLYVTVYVCMYVYLAILIVLHLMLVEQATQLRLRGLQVGACHV